jgi:hypothetical protein
MNAGLLERSYTALLAGARAVSGSVGYDCRGYATRWQDNLMPGLPLAEIADDLGGGAGRELDGKLCAAHSSAALAVNGCRELWEKWTASRPPSHLPYIRNALRSDSLMPGFTDGMATKQGR